MRGWIMYCSLDRADIVRQDPTTGEVAFHQTDHRAADEIEAEPEISVLFALTRVLNMRHLQREGDAQAEVFYVCFAPPPTFLHQAVASAGGLLEVVGAVVPYEGPRLEPADLADQAFHALAERYCRDNDVPLEEELLVQFEDETLAGVPDKNEDERGYWTRVMELAALGGELLRQRAGGRWEMAPRELSSVVPFVFTVGEGVQHFFNVITKAQRLLAQGELERVSSLLRVIDDSRLDPSGGRALVTLKPGDWEQGELVCQPLLANAAAAAVKVPLLVFGIDLPHTFVMKPASEVEDIERLKAEALANLRSIEVAVEERELGGLRLIVAAGSYYASEKILDEAFMQGLQERLGASLLLAGVPHKGLLMVTSAEVGPELVRTFVMLCQARHRDPQGELPISPIPFLVRDGKVQGLVQTEAIANPNSGSEDPDPTPEAPKRKGFWSRLFNKN